MDEEGIYGLLENPRTLYSCPIHFPYFRSQNLNTVVQHVQKLGRRMGEDEGQLSPPLRSSAALVTDGHSSSSAASGSSGLRGGQQHPTTILFCGTPLLFPTTLLYRISYITLPFIRRHRNALVQC